MRKRKGTYYIPLLPEIHEVGTSPDGMFPDCDNINVHACGRP